MLLMARLACRGWGLCCARLFWKEFWHQYTASDLVHRSLGIFSAWEKGFNTSRIFVKKAKDGKPSRLETRGRLFPDSNQGFRNKRLFLSVQQESRRNHAAVGTTAETTGPTQVRKELIGPCPPAPYIHVTHSTLHYPVGRPPRRQDDRLASSSNSFSEGVCYLENQW